LNRLCDKLIKKTKEFIKSRLREHEKKLHENDLKILKLVDEGIVLRQRLKQLEECRQLDQKDMGFKEKQVKVLGGELKQARIKIENMKKETKDLLESFLDVKLLFERLDLNV